VFKLYDYAHIADNAAISSETRLQRLTAEWIANEIRAAQPRAQLTAFGVFLAGVLVGSVIAPIIILALFGGR